VFPTSSARGQIDALDAVAARDGVAVREGKRKIASVSATWRFERFIGDLPV
jgi:hypothetical protein